ncbi:PAS domain-containing protein [Methanogenium sp. S4BF]|uniref:PAS domain-containing sensor histidine kinase n=1 Tax=Methanogenium sp. S4BF TaxID=1789226 RepID=UPI0024173333|nr:PAS domain-containing protein [Methanogenium sp. S4BF]WFN33982.1 PAS domain-containing protein [Methanogenium sp. S4BF]
MSARKDMPLPGGWHGCCENAPHAMLIADAGGEIVWANRAAARILGRESQDELSRKPVMSVLSPVRTVSWDDLSLQTRKAGTVTCSALPSGLVNGGPALDVMVSRTAEGGKEWYCIHLTPASGKRIPPRSARHDEERLNLALQCADLGAWDLNLRSGEMAVDGRWAKMIGYRADELMPFTAEQYMQFVHPDERDGYLSLYSGWSKGKNPSGSYKMRLHHKNGTWVWIRSHWQVFWSPEKDPELRVVGVHQDVTDRVKKDEAIREAQRKIAMLSSVTRHDILNQVTVIRMLYDIMEMTGEISPESDTWEQLSKINDAALAIERQIVFTRDYEDLGSQPPAWQHIGELTDRMAALPAFSALTVTCTCRTLYVYADPMLERVMHELFTNAVQHGGDVTSLTVSCSIKPDGTAVIDIADDGTGIPDDLKEKIFSRGIGMKTRYGLYLSREILSVTGIAIRETGTGEGGAVFSLSVPQENWKIPQNHSLLS